MRMRRTEVMSAQCSAALPAIARVAVAAALLLLGGCAVMPWPHRANVTPAVSGVLRDAEGPLPDVPVRVCEATRNQCCTGRAYESVTSATGAFHVRAGREFHFLVYVMAHRNFYWCLSFRPGDQWQSIGPIRDYTLIDSGPIDSEASPVECSLGVDGLSCIGPQGRLGDGG